MLSELDEQRIVRAIANAERENRGEVRVHIDARCPTRDPLARARQLYCAFELHRTRDDTGVLLYVATKSRQAAVYCGAGVHPRADPAFWQGVTDAVAEGGRAGKPVDGIVAALREIGELLREHIGGNDDAGDEVPNRVTTGDT